MIKPSKEESPNLIWGLFSSVKLAIVLLIILAIASILGTVIPQQNGAEEFAKQLSPAMLRLFQTLNFFDMYHSLWFRLLIGLLSLNLIVCSINRFPKTLKKFSALPKPDRSKPFENLPSTQTFRIKGSLKGTSEMVARFLKSKYKKIQDKESQKTHYFYGEKGRFSHFGVYLVHLSILLILTGALVGSFFGFAAYVNILEGERINTVTLREGNTRLSLGFEVACDKFVVDFYKNGAPKEYRSDLRFFADGKEAEKAIVLVNHPAQFKGITFYQSSYGSVPGGKIRLRISDPETGSKNTTMVIETKKLYELPGREGKFGIKDIKNDIMGVGPAVLISVQSGEGKVTDFWVFKNREMLKKKLPSQMANSPKFDASRFKPYTFFLDDVQPKYYTGLQVSKDPGVPIVWLGCIIMMLGCFMTFFTSHRRVWVQVSRIGNGIKISVAGTANKNPIGLNRHLEGLTNDLRNRLDERES